MGIFEKYLSIWVAICIICGVFLGSLVPNLFSSIADFEWAPVNLVVAFCIWVMVYPMMTQIDFSSIKNVGSKPKGLILTLIVNWLIKPFTMATLGWFFFKVLFVDLVDPVSANEYIAGMILLGVAPCTAMVFVWSQLTKGDPNYTLVQVSINDIIMIFAFAPITGFLLGVADIEIPWNTLVLSVGLYVVFPLVAGIVTRFQLGKGSKENNVENFLKTTKPFSIIGLLFTVVLLFGFQAEIILEKPEIIALIAVPLIVQTYGIFAMAYSAAKFIKLDHNIAAPACLIGTSNFRFHFFTNRQTS